MKRKKFKQRGSLVVTSMAVLALTVSTLGPVPVRAEEVATTQLPPSLIEQLEQWKKGVYVEFRNLRIGLSEQPRLKDGIMMVPARELLIGLGYTLSWNASDRSLHATNPDQSRPELLIHDGRSELQAGGKSVAGGTASFIDDGKLWIPLRATAQSIGLKVEWVPQNRLAVVSDPLATPQFRIMTLIPGQEVETPSVLLDQLKKAAKADAEITWVGPDHYRQKSMVMIAAGDMPSIMLFDHPYFIPNNITESITVNPGPYLDGYPTLKKLAEEGPGSRYLNGDPYFIPRLSDPHHASFPAIRKDWLDKLGLIVPSTMDELYEVMKAFTNYDPDGNGKNDTYGLTGAMFGEQSIAWVEHVFTGRPERFSIKNGQVIDHAVSEEETKALQWLAKAYQEGLVDPEFAVLGSQQVIERLENDSAGLASLTIEQAAEQSEDDAVWVPLGSLKADSSSASIAPWNSAGNGSYIITAMAKEDPDLLLQWLNYGIETTLKGGWSKLEGWSAADQAAVNSLFGQPDLLQHNPVLDALPEKVLDQYKASVEQWRKVSYEDSAFPEAELLWSQGKYIELRDELNMNKTKVIMGAISIDEWKTYQQKLVATDSYRAMMKELNELLKARL
ncbi:stalk domain-containing protein [Paenibacillus agaridevorans]|uniref:stalk domain-containing protein n=1 Tax=Paenibacillus agaridevorans TaxID=171404 RepID=UPI001BE41D39|nr:stalk domain-containing protein [Paenibacillus agaridevorans]